MTSSITYAVSSASAYSFLKGCLIRMQCWHVNVPCSKYCAMNHSRPVLNQTVATVWLSTGGGCPGSARSVKSGEADVRGRRVVSLRIHTGSNDAAVSGQSQLGGIVRGSFQETVPSKTAENTVRFNGSQPPWCRWKFSGRNNTTSAICRHRFTDVPAGSDVTDFWCLMCTSAEP